MHFGFNGVLEVINQGNFDGVEGFYFLVFDGRIIGCSKGIVLVGR